MSILEIPFEGKMSRLEKRRRGRSGEESSAIAEDVRNISTKH